MFTPFKILAHLLAALFSFSIVIAAEDKPKPATTVQDLATVNGKKITSADVERALKSAEKGLTIWKKTPPWQRSNILR